MKSMTRFHSLVCIFLHIQSVRCSQLHDHPDQAAQKRKLLPIGEGAYQDPKAVEQRTTDTRKHCEKGQWIDCYDDKGDYLDGHSYGNHKAQSALLQQYDSFVRSEGALVKAAGRMVPNLPVARAPEKRATSLRQALSAEATKFVAEAPDEGKKGGAASGGTWAVRIIVQFLFGVIYYFLIVSKYPMLEGLQPTPEAIKLQSENEISATLQTSFPNCFFSWCCSGPRAAHTFHSTGVLDYWPGCIAMSLFPCCTLWIVNSFTDLNEKLGGVKKNIFMGLVCAFCCSCCVIAQDAESLDLITGERTTLCGVASAVDEVPPPPEERSGNKFV